MILLPNYTMLNQNCTVTLSKKQTIFTRFTPFQTSQSLGILPGAKRLLEEYIEANLGAALTISELAKVVHLSDYHFARMFAVSFGKTPKQFVLARRIEKARERILYSRHSLAAIALECGFANQAHLTRHFRRHLGITPGAMRRILSV